MRKQISYIFIFWGLAFSVMCGGCGYNHRTSEAMDIAERIMESSADSALAILYGIDESELDYHGGEAHYALLKSMALDKNYIDITDDSLIAVAHKYYDKHGDTYHRMLSKYYYARVMY